MRTTSCVSIPRVAVTSALVASFWMSGVVFAQDPTPPENQDQDREHPQDKDRIVARERAVVVGPGGAVVKWKSKDGDVVVLDHPGELARHAMFIDALGGRGYLGVHVAELTPELRAHFGVPEDAGVMVAKVFADSPAERAGVLVGDILTEAGGGPITTSFELTRAVRRLERGDRVELRLWRDGVQLDLEAEVAELDRRTVRISADGDGPGMLFKIAGVPGIKNLDPAVFDIELPEGLEDAVGRHVREALGRAGAYFDSQEWKAKARRFEELDWESIEQRMKELEGRLRELEAEIESSDENGERNEEH